MDQNSERVSQTLWARGGKRAFDIVVATVLLVVLLPLLIVAGLLIKLTSRGPLLFTQDRGGLHGRNFRLMKLRTMRGGRKPDPIELVPLDHPEITRIGRVLRRLKIDELPQLINVMRGDMSLVGPRPTLHDQIERYDAFRRQRLLVRPGITGLAQVNTSAAVSWDERILYDIAYVRRCSLPLDLRILARTLLVILIGEARMTRPFSSTEYAETVPLPDEFESPV